MNTDNSDNRKTWQDAQARAIAEAIIKIGQDRTPPNPEPRRNPHYYEESHRLYQAQILKR